MVDGLSGEDGDVVGVDLDSLEGVLNYFETLDCFCYLVAVLRTLR